MVNLRSNGTTFNYFVDVISSQKKDEKKKDNLQIKKKIISFSILINKVFYSTIFLQTNIKL